MNKVGQSRPLNIVYFTRFDWETSFRRPYLETLSRYSNLLCIEPPISLDRPFRQPGALAKWLSNGLELREISDMFHLYRPPAVVPYAAAFWVPLFARLNRLVAGPFLRRAIEKLKMEDIVVIITHPRMNSVIGLLQERVLCYEVFDEYLASPRLTARGRRRTRVVEEDILRGADVVFTSAQNLRESRKRLNPNVHFIPNAVDVDFFRRALDPDTQIPTDLAQIPGPRIGLIGNVDDRLDVELVNYMAEQHPEWSIVLIGDLHGTSRFMQSPELKKSQHLSNVHYLGFKKYETLPSYLRGIDVGLLLYKINDYTVGIYPNKIYQYLAGGKPVVTTDLPEIRSLGKVVGIAKGHAEFVRLVEKALLALDDRQVARRQELAKANSVQSRTEIKISLLKATLERKLQTEGLDGDRA